MRAEYARVRTPGRTKAHPQQQIIFWLSAPVTAAVTPVAKGTRQPHWSPPGEILGDERERQSRSSRTSRQDHYHAEGSCESERIHGRRGPVRRMDWANATLTPPHGRPGTGRPALPSWATGCSLGGAEKEQKVGRAANRIRTNRPADACKGKRSRCNL